MIVGPLTDLWTRLVPMPGPTWHLARHTVAAQSDRLVKSVVPTMFAVGLLFGMMSLGDSLSQTLLANGGPKLDGTSITSLMAAIGLPLLIATAGSVGNLVMMSRRRDAELALDGVIGATPVQQRIVPALEATMVTGTAVLLGLMMAATCVGVWAYGMQYAYPKTVFAMPIGTLLWVGGITWLVTMSATVLPSLPALRRPAPRVIARLIAS